MKTKGIINDEISQIIKSCQLLNDFSPNDRKDKEKLKKRIAMLRTCLVFVETNPREELVVGLQKDYDIKIQKLEDRLHQWVKSLSKEQLDTLKNPREYYYTKLARTELNDIKHLKEQREKISYILA